MHYFDDIFQNFRSGDLLEDEFEDVLNATQDDYLLLGKHYAPYNVSDYDTNKNKVSHWSIEKKIKFIVYLCKVHHAIHQETHYPGPVERKLSSIVNSYTNVILSTNLDLSEEQIFALYNAFVQYEDRFYGFWHWPVHLFYKQIEFNYRDKQLPSHVVAMVEDVCNRSLHETFYQRKEQIHNAEIIRSFLYRKLNPEVKVRPTYFLGRDNFTPIGNAILNEQPASDLDNWFQLMILAERSAGGKPSKKFLTESKKLIDAIGASQFKGVVTKWFEALLTLENYIHRYSTSLRGETYHHSYDYFLESFNMDSLKGFIWMCSFFNDQNTITILSKLAERCFRKVPQRNPDAVAMGNACLYSLFSAKGLSGIAQLSKLRARIKMNSTVALIDKYLYEAATQRGISPSEIEDLAVDDHKLIDGKLTYQFDDITGVLELKGIGRSVISWFRADGTKQASVPQAVKDRFANKLKKFKAAQKQIDQTVSAQKERFDRMLRADRTFTVEYLQEKYVGHELLSFVLNKVIFVFRNENNSNSAIYFNKRWLTVDGEDLDIEQYTSVQLWHPVHFTASEIKAWRAFLMKEQLQQPFKQAFREIYLLTDAEINTSTYSNRMASHILKQHQYVTLAKGRNWKAALQGFWDGGIDGTAKLLLPDFNIIAEFWVDVIGGEDQHNAAGIYNYVTTDQVRFIDSKTNDVMRLLDVPIVVFSEVMRDVDLFVGVASVGNDPTWSDNGGLPNHRDYWQAYSFGDLSELAKNRKETLLNLIPRLKIASVTSVVDKFVVVQGKLRTYKIHIGSTNILMEPNDQYLCIVADRSKSDISQTLFLPFEGDAGLSVLISKALLLADDDKIKDPTIVSQIKRV